MTQVKLIIGKDDTTKFENQIACLIEQGWKIEGLTWYWDYPVALLSNSTLPTPTICQFTTKCGMKNESS